MALGPIMLGVKGLALQAEERDMLREPKVGGVILFARNYEDTEQLRALVTSIHDLRQPRLLVAVDHEGGRVQRFRNGFTRIPAAQFFGAQYDQDRPRALRLARAAGWVLAAELRAVGVDFSFTPVLDLDRGLCSAIGDRAFHRDPDAVAALAHSVVEGMKEVGMAATGKHFPGHGGVDVDTHHGVAIDRRGHADIEMADLVPFERLIRWGLAGIMPAHVVFMDVDTVPAGFSSIWLQTILRGRLGFQGLIFSDDLEMEGAGVAGDIVARGEAALGAGCDMVLVCNQTALMMQMIDGLRGYADNPVAQLRRARMHGRDGAIPNIRENEQWRQYVAALGDVSTA